jgi:acyl-CoA reductase-like NAD-dependent aldehyde dehydrogenase
MRRKFRAFAVTAAVLVIAIQFVRPARTNPAVDPTRALTAMHPVPSHAAGVLDRACRDCHSNDTRWPWYSNVAPVSWFVIDHVNHARSHFNYSDWAGYSLEDRARLLKNSCDLAREREMPLQSYLWMHGAARLSTADIDAVCSLVR